VLWVLGSLVGIWIRGSVQLTYRCGFVSWSGSCSFRHKKS